MLDAYIDFGGIRVDLADEDLILIFRKWYPLSLDGLANSVVETSNFGELIWTLSDVDPNSSLMDSIFEKHKKDYFLIKQIANVSSFFKYRKDEELIQLMDTNPPIAERFISNDGLEEILNRINVLNWLLENGSDTVLRKIAGDCHAPAELLKQLAKHANQSIALLAKHRLSQIKE